MNPSPLMGILVWITLEVGEQNRRVPFYTRVGALRFRLKEIEYSIVWEKALGDLGEEDIIVKAVRLSLLCLLLS